MESLNMNTLASSLPNSANAEKQLMDNFKAAALSITTLYRSSLDTSKQAYSAGYATCLQDVLQFVEAGVSVSGNEGGEEMTIGRVMDWVEARLEAIKSTQEEEEEDRLKEGPSKSHVEDAAKDDRDRKARKSPASTSTNLPRLHRRSKENLQVSEAPQSHPPQPNPTPSPRLPSTSPPAQAFSSPSPPPQPQTYTRTFRSKRGLKDLGPIMPFNMDALGGNVTGPVSITATSGNIPFTFSSDVVSPLPLPPVGSKRRHAAIAAESPASSSGPTTPIPAQASGHGHSTRRKRGRSGRERDREYHGQSTNGNGNMNGNLNQGPTFGDAMDVEEEGRERKRVARR